MAEIGGVEETEEVETEDAGVPARITGAEDGPGHQSTEGGAPLPTTGEEISGAAAEVSPRGGENTPPEDTESRSNDPILSHINYKPSTILINLMFFFYNC